MKYGQGLLKASRKSNSRVMHLKDVEELEKTKANAELRLKAIENAKLLMPTLTCQRVAGAPALFSTAEPQINEPGNAMRGTWKVVKKHGYADFEKYLSGFIVDYFKHDLRRRWLEKQKREAEQNAKEGELILFMDFSAKMEMVQQMWMPEDSKAPNSIAVLVIIAGWRGEDGKMHYRTFDYVSDDLTQDAVWVNGALKKLFQMLSRETTTAANQTVPILVKPGTKITVVSDGGPHHFWNQVMLLFFFKNWFCKSYSCCCLSVRPEHSRNLIIIIIIIKGWHVGPGKVNGV
jgi:hypothetical protein